MKKLILTSAAIIALGSTAVQAQMQSGDMSSDDMSAQDSMSMQQSPTMTPQQQAVYASLTAEQKAGFDSWDLQQKGLYFALSAEQRAQLWALPAAQRATAWMQIRKAAGLPETSAMSSGAMGHDKMGHDNMSTGAMDHNNMSTGAMSGGMMADGDAATAESGRLNPPPPASAMTRDYPVCSAKIQDKCVNPRAAQEK